MDTHFLAWLALLTLALAWRTVPAQAEFRVVGEVDYQRGSDPKATFEFEFQSRHEAWQLVIEQKVKVRGTSEEQTHRFTMGAVDLKEVYEVRSITGYFPGGATGKGPGGDLPAALPKRGAYHLAKVTPGPVPFDCGLRVMPFLWLAYGSRPYFESLKTNEVIPFYHEYAGRWGDWNYRQRAVWNLSGVEPRLPSSVVYFNAGQQMDRQVVNGKVTTNVVWRPHPPPFNEGFTNAYYRVLASTNLGNFIFPLRFVFEEYRPGSSGRLQTNVTVAGRLRTMMGHAPLKDFRPPLPAGAVVLDERIRTNADPSTVGGYQAQAWLSKKEAERARATAGKTVPRREWWRSPWVVAVVVVLLLMPPVLAWHRSRQAKAAATSMESP